LERFLTPTYWLSVLASMRQWLVSDVLTTRAIIELATLAACLLVAVFIARPLRGPILRFVDRRQWGSYPAGRFLQMFARLLNYLVSIGLLWLALGVFRQAGWTGRILDVAGSLLTAWFVIRLSTAIVRETGWAKVIAVFAWSLAALHIVGWLVPTLALFDKLAINLGGVRFTLLLVIKAVIVLACLLWAATSASAVIEKRIMAFDGLTPSVQVLLSKTLKITLLVVALLVTLSVLGINLSAFAFFGGAVGVGVGFGLQKVVSNLVSGVILLMDRSIKPGDVIEVGQTYGRIQSLSARYVSVVTRDGTEFLIPNEDLITQQVINWTYSNKLIRLKILIGVAYDSDIHQVMRLMIAASQRVPRVLEEPGPVCQLRNFGDSAIEMELRIWIKDPENGIANVSSAARVAIWDSFKQHGIEIPFPQRDLHLKSGLADVRA
jgi:small-conductance mechanosensitive channel